MRVCRESLLFVCVAVALSVAFVIGAGAATDDERAWAKVSPELRALYTAFVGAREGGRSVSKPDSGITIVEDRVIVDAVAAADAEDLRRDLVALGLREAATAGRIVSGQLPIVAIPAAAALPTLKFVRAAVTAPRGAAGRGVQQQ